MKFPTNELLSVEDIRTLETLISINGCSMFELMHRAGVASAQYVIEHFPSADRVVIVCGKGNNGGDGWVAARYLSTHGVPVTLITPPSESITAEPACSHAHIVLDDIASNKTPLLIHIEDPHENELGELSSTLTSKSIIIDAILGIGFSGAEIRTPFDAWVTWMNAQRGISGATILALDIPSGLHADEGTYARTTTHAQATITMLASKRAFTSENVTFTGEVTCATLLTPGETSRLQKALSRL